MGRGGLATADAGEVRSERKGEVNGRSGVALGLGRVRRAGPAGPVGNKIGMRQGGAAANEASSKDGEEGEAGSSEE